MKRSALHHPASQRQQRGAAALIVTMVLFFAMTLAAAYVNRNLVFEQRISANQYRATQAFEAAEAGLEWALAQLNNPLKLEADCRPGTSAQAKTFRERYLGFDAASATHTPNIGRKPGSRWRCNPPAFAAARAGIALARAAATPR